MKNIVLVDDHILVRNGLKELIEKLGSYKVIRELNNGREIIEAFPIHPVPDLIVMDLTMPEMNGDQVVEFMNQQKINIPVLILTLNHDENRIVRLFRAGIRGYLEKDCTAVTMKRALEEIFSHGYFHNELLTYALRHSENSKKSEKEIILEKLTDREMEFLKLVCHADEYTYDQIAGMMGVVRRTVDGYRESIFEKFDIKSKTGLVLFVFKYNLIDVFGF